MQMKIFEVALVSCLRGAAHRMTASLHAGQLHALFDGPQAEHNDPRAVGIEQDGGVPRVLVYQAHERIDVGRLADEQPVVANRRLELNRFEEFARAR
jgi:hypothetical protein